MPEGRATPTVLTAGYQDHTPASFIEHLCAHDVELVADVRELPLSRKKGFSKGPLSQAVEAAGMAYVHLKDLGAPKHIRDPYKAGGSAEAFDSAFGRHLARQGDALEWLVKLAREKRTVLVCLEADATACHRSIVAEALAKEGFEVRHV